MKQVKLDHQTEDTIKEFHKQTDYKDLPVEVLQKSFQTKFDFLNEKLDHYFANLDSLIDQRIQVRDKKVFLERKEKIKFYSKIGGIFLSGNIFQIVLSLLGVF